MSDCEHTGAGVVDSRPPDYVRRGKRFFRDLPYNCIVIRTRKCQICQRRWKTVEVDKEYIDGLIKERTQIEQRILGEICQYLQSKIFGKGNT